MVQKCARLYDVQKGLDRSDSDNSIEVHKKK